MNETNTARIVAAAPRLFDPSPPSCWPDRWLTRTAYRTMPERWVPAFDALTRRWPRVFRNRSRAYPRGDVYASWGFECGDGWADLLERLFARLDAIAPKGCVVEQAKQKLGGLRVYISESNDATDAAVMAAEAEAWVTCETCGAPGELRGRTWVRRVRCLGCLRAEEPFAFRRDRDPF